MTPQKIALMSDSCIDLSPDVLRENHIYTVPLRILCADGEYLDGVDIHNEDVYRRLHAGELPKTSLPSTEDMEQTLKQILDDGYDGIIAIMLSSGLSGTCNLTRLAAEELEDQCGGKIRMCVYDSLSGSLGQAMTVMQILEDLHGGMGWDELTQNRIPFLLAHTHPFFTVNTLEYLLRGGRIGKVTAAAGTLLQIKPVITFAEDGQLQSIAKARGRHQVIDKLVEMTVRYCGSHKKYNIAVANGGAREEMETVRRKLCAALPDYLNIWEGEIDSTLSVYIGDGILGAAVQTLD